MTTSDTRGVSSERGVDWRWRAACAGMDTNRWYPEDIVGRKEEDKRLRGIIRREALAVCESCPVRLTCLEDALATEGGAYTATWGIRGGLIPGDRVRLASERRKAVTG